MMADVEKFHFRLVLLGSHGTGKTSILNKFLFKKFETKYKPTVEDLFTKQFDLGSIEIKVDFLDTSGSMQFPAMRRLSITNGNAFLIVYAVDDESSYDVLKMCIAEIQEIRPDYQEIPIVFAGNKCDIPREKRKVLKETVSNYVHYELPRLRAKVIECSCRDGINIENIFRSYLSLAKVTLSGANVHQQQHQQQQHHHQQQQQHTTNSKNVYRPASNPIFIQGFDEDANSKRSSSLKIALGVRKSCDASMILPSKNKLNSQQNNANSNDHAGGNISASDNDITTELVNLETAIRSKLNIDNGSSSKPRSRSLIWRPNRRSTTSRTTSESSECRTS